MLGIKHAIEKLLYWMVPLSLVLVVWGIYSNATDDLNYWSGRALRGFGIWLLGVLFSGVIVWRIAKKYSNHSLLALVIAFLLVAAGFYSSLVATYFLISIAVLGRLLFFLLAGHEQSVRFYEVLIAGLIGYLTIFGVCIHFPINYPIVYVVILLLPFSALFNPAFRSQCYWQCSTSMKDFSQLLASINRWHFLVFVWFVGFVATYALLPVVLTDDSSYHLSMWTQLTYQYQYLFDAKTVIWAVSPFAVDLIHSIISLVSGTNARASINLMLYILLLAGLWRLVGRVLSYPAKSMLVVALFASTPMLANLLQGLQTDLFLALLSVVGGLIVLDAERENSYRLLSVVLLGCLYCATKLPAVILAMGMFFAVLIVIRGPLFPEYEQRRSVLRLMLLSIPGCFVALHSYVVAFLTTGNPVLPLYNAFFQSPFFDPVNFKDGRFDKGASSESYWGFYFDTGTYFESLDFVAGFQYLLLFPLAILLLLLLRKRTTLWGLMLPIMLYGGLMFSTMQYLRYFFAILPLVTLIIASLLCRDYQGKSLARVFLIYIFINLVMLPGVSDNFSFNNLSSLLEKNRHNILSQVNPEVLMNDYINHTHGVTNVLYDVARPNGATLAGTPFYLAWVAPQHLNISKTWSGDSDALNFLKQNAISYVYWYKPYENNPDPLRQNIKRVIEKHGVLEKDIGGLQLYRIEEDNRNGVL